MGPEVTKAGHHTGRSAFVPAGAIRPVWGHQGRASHKAVGVRPGWRDPSCVVVCAPRSRWPPHETPLCPGNYRRSGRVARLGSGSAEVREWRRRRAPSVGLVRRLEPERPELAAHPMRHAGFEERERGWRRSVLGPTRHSCRQSDAWAESHGNVNIYIRSILTNRFSEKRFGVTQPHFLPVRQCVVSINTWTPMLTCNLSLTVDSLHQLNSVLQMYPVPIHGIWCFLYAPQFLFLALSLVSHLPICDRRHSARSRRSPLSPVIDIDVSVSRNRCLRRRAAGGALLEDDGAVHHQRGAERDDHRRPRDVAPDLHQGPPSGRDQRDLRPHLV